MSVLVIDLFLLSISSWFSLGRLFFSFFKKLLIYLAALGLHCCLWVFPGCREWELLFIVVHELLFTVASLVVEPSSGVRGLGTCGLVAQLLRCMGLVVPQRVRSSLTREWSHVASTGRWILNHSTSREALGVFWFLWTSSVIHWLLSGMLFSLHIFVFFYRFCNSSL